MQSKGPDHSYREKGFMNFSSTLLNAEIGKSDKPNGQTKEGVGEESFLRAKQLLKIRYF